MYILGLFIFTILIYNINCQKEIINKLYANHVQSNLAQCAADIAIANFEFTLTTLVVCRTMQSIGMSDFIRKYGGTIIVNRGLVKMPQRIEIFRQFVFYISDTEEFYTIIPFVKQRGYDNTGKITIVCVAPWPEECDAKSIFRSCQDNYVTNVVLLSWNNANVSIKSYIPYRPESCRNCDPVLLTCWNVTHRLDAELNLFRDKLRNMYGCQLTVSTVKQQPFVFVNVLSGGQKVTTVYGIEGSILVELAKILNFTAVYIFPIEQTPGYFDGHAWKGSLGDVVAGRANISACAAALNLERAEALQTSFPYHSIDMVWTGPPTELEPTWKHLILPMRLWLWLGIVATYATVFFLSLIFKIRSFRKFWRWNLNMGDVTNSILSESWIVFMGQYLEIKSRKRFVLYIIMLWLWFSFFMRNAYQGALFGALKKEVYVNDIKSFKEAVQNGYRFGGAFSSKMYYEYEPEVFEYYEEVMSEDFSTTLNDLADRKYKFLLAIQKETTLSYLQSFNGTKWLLILPDKIVNTPSVFFMRKYSPLADPTNRVMSALFESGFPQLFISTFSSEKFIDNEIRTNKRVQASLNLNQLSGSFAVLVVGCLLSTCFFIIELILGKSILITLDDN